MNSARFVLVLFALIAVCSIVSADGIPINPYDFHLEPMGQESQLAYIDFDGQGYSLYLMAGMDFTSTDQDEIMWIVPFKEVPKNINLEKTTYDKFKQDFSEFDKGIDKAVKLKKDFEGYQTAALILPAAHFIPSIPFFVVMGSLSMVSMQGASSGGRYGYEGIVPEKSFDFGELGRADIFTISDKTTLEQFFKEKGKPVPENISQYLNRSIAVFQVNRVSDKFEVLARFDFENSAEIFYPSSTTHLWNEMPEEYVIKIRAPVDFALWPNIEPNLEINDMEYQYLIFSPSCAGLNSYDYYDCRDYFEYGKEVRDSDGLLESMPFMEEPLRLLDEDLEISVKPERKQFPLGMHLTKSVNPLIFGVLIVFISWIAAGFVHYRNKKLKPKDILIQCLGFAVIWTALNIIFSIVFLAVIIALYMVFAFGFLLLIGLIASGGLTNNYWVYSFIPLLFLIFLGASLIATGYLFKKTVINHEKKLFKWAKTKTTMKDLGIVLFLAFAFFVCLSILFWFIFNLPV